MSETVLTPGSNRSPGTLIPIPTPDDSVSAGVDIGGTRVKLGLVHAGRVLVTQTLPTNPLGPAQTLSQVASAVRNLLPAGSRLQGVGIGCAGLVEDGIVRMARNLPGWSDFNLQMAVEDLLEVPTRVVPDSAAVAAGEYLASGRPDARGMFVFVLGTGVGTAFVANSVVWPGQGGFMLMPGVDGNDGAPRYLEDLVSGSAIRRRFADLRGGHGNGAQTPSAPEVTAENVWHAATGGDRLARQVFSEAGQSLGLAAANVCHLLGFDEVVISGGVSRAGETLLGPARACFEAHLLPTFRDRRLVGSYAGEAAGILGAARLVTTSPSPLICA